MKITSKSTVDILNIQQKPDGSNAKNIASKILNMLKKIVSSPEKMNKNTSIKNGSPENYSNDMSSPEKMNKNTPIKNGSPENYSNDISMPKKGILKKNVDLAIDNSHTSQQLDVDSEIFEQFARDVNTQTYVYNGNWNAGGNTQTYATKPSVRFSEKVSAITIDNIPSEEKLKNNSD